MAKKPKAQPQEEPVPDKKAKKGKNKDDKKDGAKEDLKPNRGLNLEGNFGWTGKLPLTLLYEFCQKHKWMKPIVNNKTSPMGHTTTIYIMWENPKTKEVIKLGYNPKIFTNTANEAKHLTATYTLFRVNYRTNMLMILPKIFSDHWKLFDAERKELLAKDKVKHDVFYSDKPFQTYLQEQERKAKLKLKQEKEKQQDLLVKKPVKLKYNEVQEIVKLYKKLHLEPVQTFSKKIWENSPLFDLDSDLRCRIENLIKSFINWSLMDTSEYVNPDRLVKFLSSLGFRLEHIQEAMSYTKGFNSVLEFLLFHLPEDDLPLLFTKTNDHNTNQIKISKDTSYEANLKYLKNTGFNNDDINTHLNDNPKQTLINLCKTLVSPELLYDDYVDLGLTSDELWQNEIQSLQAMDYNIEVIDNLTVNLQGKIQLQIVKGEEYPNELVGIKILSEVPNYVKLSILKKIVEYLYENKYIGSEYLFSILDYTNENYKQLLDNPGQLVDKKFKAKHLTINETTTVIKNFRNSYKVNDSKISEHYRKKTSDLKYQLLVDDRAKLPAWQKQNSIIELVLNNQVVLITGETGSGKSTQIVQFIVDELSAKSDFKSRVMVTQPRRISTLGLADRISAERLDKVGNEVGYIIRGELKVSDLTRITFVTTGVLLRLIQGSGDSYLKSIQYVVIDEVHERSVDSDFLLILLKNNLHKFPNLKVILMSATIDKLIFNNFFGFQLPHLHIEGRTFPIKDYYLDYVLDELDYQLELNGTVIKPQPDSQFFKSGGLNYDLIVELVYKLRNSNGSILIFMSGIFEINQLKAKVSSYFDEAGENCLVLPLHSALSSKEQTRVFDNVNCLKVIIATNIAETSITIPDCTVVIDTGRVKTIRYDPTTKTTKLVETWCSQAEVMQRRGRSGRIQKGNCYHLYTQETFDTMIKQPIPEIKRTNLDNLFLIIKSMGVDNVQEFLANGIDPPSELAIYNSELTLKRIGALNESGTLTSMGKYLSLIPTDLSNAKLIILGCLFGCVNNSLLLAAIKTIGAPFQRSFELRSQVKGVLSSYSKGNGDFIGSLNIVKAYIKSKSKNKFLNENFLNYNTMKEILSTFDQYKTLLKELNFHKHNQEDMNRNDTNYKVLKSLITAAYYPNISKVFYPDTKYVAGLGGAIEVNPDERLIRYFVEHKDEELTRKRERQRLLDMKYANRKKKWAERDSDVRVTLEDSSDEETEQKFHNMVDFVPKRVFIHPSSTFFDKKSQIDEDIEDYDPEEATPVVIPQLMQKPPFIVYGSTYETTKHFINEITPTNVVSVLLFGGGIDYNLNLSHGKVSPGIVVDNWITVRTWCKNAVLVKNLRQLLDQIIDYKLSSLTHDEGDYVEILTLIEGLIS